MYRLETSMQESGSSWNRTNRALIYSQRWHLASSTPAWLTLMFASHYSVVGCRASQHGRALFPTGLGFSACVVTLTRGDSALLGTQLICLGLCVG